MEQMEQDATPKASWRQKWQKLDYYAKLRYGGMAVAVVLVAGVGTTAVLARNGTIRIAGMTILAGCITPGTATITPSSEVIPMFTTATFRLTVTGSPCPGSRDYVVSIVPHSDVNTDVFLVLESSAYQSPGWYGGFRIRLDPNQSYSLNFTATSYHSVPNGPGSTRDSHIELDPGASTIIDGNYRWSPRSLVNITVPAYGLPAGGGSGGRGGTPDTTPPTVSLNTPTPTCGGRLCGTVSLSAWATDNVGVTKVQFILDSNSATPLAEVTSSNPYVFNWDTCTTTNATHTLSATAWDAAGNTRTSSPVTIRVRNSSCTSSTPAPTITSFTASPASITSGQSSNLSWSVSGATSLSIDQGVGDVTNLTSKSVTPSVTTTYTLTATNSSGSTTATAPVTVSNNSGGPQQVATPSISPNGGSFTDTQSVTISTSTAGALIRYTTDGSTPSSTAGIFYTSAFPVSSTATVKAIAYESGMTNSSVASALFTIQPPPPPSGPALNFSSPSDGQQIVNSTFTISVQSSESTTIELYNNSTFIRRCTNQTTCAVGYSKSSLPVGTSSIIANAIGPDGSILSTASVTVTR